MTQSPTGDNGRTVVTVWFATHPFPGYMDPLEKMAREFENAHPGYRLDVVGHDFREMPAKVVAAVAEGNPPDVAEYYHTASQLARDTRDRDGRPLFTSVTRAVAGRRSILGEPVVLDDIVPTIRDYYSYRGELVSMPMTATTTLLFSNATLLRAAGLPRPPATWAELEAACDAISALDSGPRHGVTWPLHGWIFQQAVAEQGALLADADNGRTGRATRVHLDSPEMLRFATWWKKLHDTGRHLSTGEPGDWLAGLEAFVQQRVAFAVFSSAMCGVALHMAGAAGFDVAVSASLRRGEVPYAGHTISGQSLWLRDGLDEATRDGALAFLQFLDNPGNVAEWHHTQGFIPVTQAGSALLEEQGWFDEHPFHRAASDQVRTSDRSPAALGAFLGGFAGIQRLAMGAMQDVLTGGAEPAARFRRADAEAQDLLRAHNARCEAGQSPDRLEVA